MHPCNVKDVHILLSHIALIRFNRSFADHGTIIHKELAFLSPGRPRCPLCHRLQTIVAHILVLFLCTTILLCLGHGMNVNASQSELNVKRSDPADFLFRAATSAVQIEGSARENGKGLSTWEKYAARFQGDYTA